MLNSDIKRALGSNPGTLKMQEALTRSEADLAVLTDAVAAAPHDPFLMAAYKETLDRTQLHLQLAGKVSKKHHDAAMSVIANMKG